ncbi:MAG: tryptophan--tRNA ligase [Bacteroidales bacterium]|jgi:tryptophanyl-tRNA synthetase|nr:tryptophan--tRNA ligase [Bacteroidales bacterium]
MSKEENIVLSGVRPTGDLHLGNYFGALRNFVKLQDTHTCYFFIADWHSLTTHPAPEDLYRNVRQVMALYLAAGIDPEKSTLYVQSDVPEICELYLLLNMIAYVGEVERTTTFKDKVRLHPGNINLGLLSYPVLMASDILIHRSHKVPVGKDQEQHLELARVYARRFNSTYRCEVFPEPEAFNFGANLVKVPGLNGAGKMSKSEGNGIFLTDSAEDIRKKVMKAVTDAGPAEPNQTPPEAIQNLFTIMELVSSADTLQHFKQQYAQCAIRYGDLKKQLAEDVNLFVAPIRERYNDIYSNDELLGKVAAMGREKARASASATLAQVRKAIGIVRN